MHSSRRRLRRRPAESPRVGSPHSSRDGQRSPVSSRSVRTATSARLRTLASTTHSRPGHLHPGHTPSTLTPLQVLCGYRQWSSSYAPVRRSRSLTPTLTKRPYRSPHPPRTRLALPIRPAPWRAQQPSSLLKVMEALSSAVRESAQLDIAARTAGAFSRHSSSPSPLHQPYCPTIGYVRRLPHPRPLPLAERAHARASLDVHPCL